MSLQHCVTYVYSTINMYKIRNILSRTSDRTTHIVADWIKPLNHYESSISLLQTSWGGGGDRGHCEEAGAEGEMMMEAKM